MLYIILGSNPETESPKKPVCTTDNVTKQVFEIEEKIYYLLNLDNPTQVNIAYHFDLLNLTSLVYLNLVPE